MHQYASLSLCYFDTNYVISLHHQQLDVGFHEQGDTSMIVTCWSKGGRTAVIVLGREDTDSMKGFINVHAHLAYGVIFSYHAHAAAVFI